MRRKDSQDLILLDSQKAVQVSQALPILVGQTTPARTRRCRRKTSFAKCAGFRKTRFRSPVSHAVPNLSEMGNGIYTNDNVIHTFEEVLEAQNMNLGNDLASKDGKTMFKGIPVMYAPYLDDDSSDPVYMLDWKWLALGMLDGWMDKSSGPTPVAGKHNVRANYLDSGFNMVCTDLRRHAVFHKGV